ncbi:G patch domain-containing protein [Microdochium nivale]|nr:G patch domain-containing protein [Microdochium nivale]
MPNIPPAAHAPRIAIRFGATTSASGATKPSSLARKSNPPSTLGKRSRPHGLGGDSESEDDEVVGKLEAVTGFGADGAEHKAKPRNGRADTAAASKSPFVIGGHKNRDWKGEIRSRGTNEASIARPSANPTNDALQETELSDQQKDIQWGLSVSRKEPQCAAKRDADTNDAKSNGTEPPSSPPKDEHQDAIDALMGKRRKTEQDIVIASEKSQTKGPTPVDEEDSYRRAVEAAAEVSTVDEYDQIPDGEFGAAMLRGMGWKGEQRAPEAKEVKRRTQFMGLGAKEDQEIKQAELTKKHGHRERRPRLEDYRSSKDKERRDRDDRHRDSYKSERDRERHRDSHARRSNNQDRDRDRHRHDDRRSRR